MSTLILDLGTTYFKAVLFDAAGQTAALARRETPLVHPQPGRVEIDPAAFQATIASLLNELRQTSPAVWADIQHVSFATQTNSFLLLDDHDQPLTPILVWTDARARDMDQLEINDYRLTGMPALGHLPAPAKLRWLARHAPDAWGRARRFCLLSDYLTLWFTGEHVTEAGAAGLTGLLDIHRLVWRDDALAALQGEHLQMPQPLRAGAALGRLRPDIASRLGLPATCGFTLGCLDQYASALAAGLLTDAGVCETTGTVLATVTVALAFGADLQARGIVQGPTSRADRYFRMCFGSTSANLLAAYRKACAPDLSYEQLDALAAAVPADALELRLVSFAEDGSAMRFVPAGPRGRETRGREVRAIYRRVAEALRDQLATLCGDEPPARLISLGGGARSPTWLSIKADLLGLAPQPLPTDEPTAAGVLRLVDRSSRS